MGRLNQVQGYAATACRGSAGDGGTLTILDAHWRASTPAPPRTPDTPSACRGRALARRLRLL
eukprot:2118396-Alexandrium_andersonii.AAC.1